MEKWLVVSVYKSSAQNITYFFFTGCLKLLILTSDNKGVTKFMDLYNLIKLIKATTCVKGTKSCIDLLLTNQSSYLILFLPSSLNLDPQATGLKFTFPLLKIEW